jgi:hypothetical protein
MITSILFIFECSKICTEIGIWINYLRGNAIYGGFFWMATKFFKHVKNICGKISAYKK